MKLIASIGVTAQVGPDDWKRETLLFEVRSGESAESLFARVLCKSKKFISWDNSIAITAIEESEAAGE